PRRRARPGPASRRGPRRRTARGRRPRAWVGRTCAGRWVTGGGGGGGLGGDVGGGLAGERGQAADRAGGRGELHRDADGPDGALARVLDGVEQVAFADVLVLVRVVQLEHRRHRDAVLRADLGPFLGGQRRCARRDLLGQPVVVGAVDGVAVDARV